MATVQIKHIPDDVHQTLRRRAAEKGQSLQEYLLGQLTEQARQPTVEELFARLADEPVEGGAVRAFDALL